MTYNWPDKSPRLVEVHRYWRDGKIVSMRGLPPGSYHVMLKKVQQDWRGRLQYHWVLLSYDRLDPVTADRLRRQDHHANH